MRSKRHIFLFLIPMVCLLAACRPSVVLYSFKPVSPSGWSCLDTLRWTLPADSTERIHTFSLGVRYTDRMPYRNLWLVLEQRASGQHPRRDTLCLSLQEGTEPWQVGGVICHQAEAICTAAITKPQEATDLLVYHVMSDQEVRGITEVSLKVE